MLTCGLVVDTGCFANQLFCKSKAVNMRRTIRFIAILYLILPCLTAVALAAGDEGNFKKLGAFQMTGTAAGECIPQEGKYADNLRKIR